VHRVGLGRRVAGFEDIEHGWVARWQVGAEEVGVEFLNRGVAGWEDTADSGGVCGEKGVAGGDAREVVLVYDD
jgi:hypothetical protein